MKCEGFDGMKRTIAIISFLCFAVAGAAAQKPAKNDPSQYLIAVHVSASESDLSNPGGATQTLTVTIAGKHYLLRGFLISADLIDPGDYRAKLITDEHKASYLTRQEYEFLFPDGKTWRCGLVRESE